MAGTLLHRLFHHCHLVNTRGNRCGCGGGMTWSRRSGRFLRGSTRNKCRLPKQRHLGEAARASGADLRSLRSLRPRPTRPSGNSSPAVYPTETPPDPVEPPLRRHPITRASGTFSKPRSGTFSTPIDTALLGRVSRFRAMPVGDRRSSDAGRRPPPGELAGAPCGGRCCWGGFRASARCRSEAPTGRTGRRSMWGAALLGRVSRSRAMPVGDRRSSDAGQRPPPGELASAPSVVGAGFALPRDAGRRPPPGELASAPSHADRVPEFHAVHKKPAGWRVSRGAAIAAPRGVPADFGRGQVIVR